MKKPVIVQWLERQSCKLQASHIRRVAGSNPAPDVQHIVLTRIPVPWPASLWGELTYANELPLDCSGCPEWVGINRHVLETPGPLGDRPLQTVGRTPRALSAFPSRATCISNNNKTNLEVSQKALLPK